MPSHLLKGFEYNMLVVYHPTINTAPIDLALWIEHMLYPRKSPYYPEYCEDRWRIAFAGYPRHCGNLDWLVVVMDSHSNTGISHTLCQRGKWRLQIIHNANSHDWMVDGLLIPSSDLPNNCKIVATRFYHFYHFTSIHTLLDWRILSQSTVHRIQYYFNIGMIEQWVSICDQTVYNLQGISTLVHHTISCLTISSFEQPTHGAIWWRIHRFHTISFKKRAYSSSSFFALTPSFFASNNRAVISSIFFIVRFKKPITSSRKNGRRSATLSSIWLRIPRLFTPNMEHKSTSVSMLSVFVLKKASIADTPNPP